MARKSKTELSENTTMVFEAPDEPEIEPVVAIKDDEFFSKPEKKEQEEDLPIIEVSASEQEQYCNITGLKPVYGRNRDGDITCELRKGSLPAMPAQKRNPDSAPEPVIAFGVTKERALINAVEMYRAHLKELVKMGQQVKAPEEFAAKMEAFPEAAAKIFPPMEMEAGYVNQQIAEDTYTFLCALQTYLDWYMGKRLSESDSGLRNKLKALIDEEA